MFQNTSISQNTLIHYSRKVHRGILFWRQQSTVVGKVSVWQFFYCFLLQVSLRKKPGKQFSSPENNYHWHASFVRGGSHGGTAARATRLAVHPAAAKRCHGCTQQQFTPTRHSGPFASFQKLRRLGVEVNLKVNCNKYLHSLYSRSLLACLVYFP